MREVFADFEARVREINIYFKFLEDTVNLSVSCQSLIGDSSSSGFGLLNPDLIKIFKANGFLLLYNLVESCVHNALANMYTEIQHLSLPYKDISDEFRAIWFDAHYRNSFNATANWNTGKAAAKNMIHHVLNELPLNFEGRSLKIGGNLDAKKIRALCDDHGIPLENINRACGQHLQIVKEKRNALAHGSISFTECGRDHTHSDLERYKNDAIEYLRQVLEHISNFTAERKFQRHTARNP